MRKVKFLEQQMSKWEKFNFYFPQILGKGEGSDSMERFYEEFLAEGFNLFVTGK